MVWQGCGCSLGQVSNECRERLVDIPLHRSALAIDAETQIPRVVACQVTGQHEQSKSWWSLSLGVFRPVSQCPQLCCEIPALRRNSSPEPAGAVERCERICVAATAPEVLSDPGDAPSKSTETGEWHGARRGWRQVGWASYCSSCRSRCFFSIRSQRGALRLTKRRS